MSRIPFLFLVNVGLVYSIGRAAATYLSVCIVKNKLMPAGLPIEVCDSRAPVCAPASRPAGRYVCAPASRYISIDVCAPASRSVACISCALRPAPCASAVRRPAALRSLAPSGLDGRPSPADHRHELGAQRGTKKRAPKGPWFYSIHSSGCGDMI